MKAEEVRQVVDEGGGGVETPLKATCDWLNF